MDLGLILILAAVAVVVVVEIVILLLLRKPSKKKAPPPAPESRQASPPPRPKPGPAVSTTKPAGTRQEPTRPALVPDENADRDIDAAIRNLDSSTDDMMDTKTDSPEGKD
jgi:cell division protein FtsN